MNMKLWVPLLLAGAMGIVAAKLGRNMLSGRSITATPGSSISVAVAAADLEPGHEITSADIKAVKMPLESVPKGSFAQADELQGRVVTSQIVTGQAVLEPVLAPKGSGRGGIHLWCPRACGRFQSMSVNRLPWADCSSPVVMWTSSAP